jgi:hypothetical protein
MEDGFITPRLLARDDPLANAYGKPGQLLIAAGEFIVGYRRQYDQDLLASLDPLPAQPDWTRNGSFLVFRRLRQDVAKFRRFLIAAAANLASKPEWEGATPERLAALLVGRWPSGAPCCGRLPRTIPRSEQTTLRTITSFSLRIVLARSWCTKARRSLSLARKSIVPAMSAHLQRTSARPTRATSVRSQARR